MRTKDLLTKLGSLRVNHEDGNKYITLEVSSPPLLRLYSSAHKMCNNRVFKHASSLPTWIAFSTTLQVLRI